MAHLYVEYSDLTKVGLVKNIPTTSQIWSELNEVMVRGGTLVKRPGLVKIGSSLPAGVELSNPLGFITHKYEQSMPKGQRLSPNETLANSGWTVVGAASAHQALQDNANYVRATVAGSSLTIGYDNLSGTWSNITGVSFPLIVKRKVDTTQRISLYTQGVGSEIPLGTFTISPGSEEWIGITPSYSGFTTTDVNALKLRLVKETTYTPGTGVLASTDVTTPNAQYLSYVGPDMATSLATNDGDTSYVQFTKPPGGWGVVMVVKFPYVPGASNLKARITVRGLSSGPWGIDVYFYGMFTDGTLNHNLYGEAQGVSGSGTSYVTVSANVPQGAGGTYTGFVLRGEDPQSVRVTEYVLTYDVLVADTTTPLEITWNAANVSGDGDSVSRFALLMPSAKGFLRVSEDLTTYTDVHGTVATPIGAPDMQYDWAVFLNKVYVVNGRDYIYWYPSATDTFAQFTSGPTGRTCATFAKRLFLGDVLESGARSASRVRWSKVGDASNWTDATSGNLNLDETTGKVVKLKPIVERSSELVGTLVAYKQLGIYHIAATTDPSIPFIAKLMDGSAGAIAAGSVKGFVDKGGREIHVFLGRVGNTVNVLAWDGAQTLPIGDDVVPILNEQADTFNLDKSVADIDSYGNYILYFPLLGESLLSTALVYNFDKKFWSLWRTSGVTSLGSWQPNNRGLIMAVGRPDGLAYRFDQDLAQDQNPTDTSAIATTLTTGDLTLPVTDPTSSTAVFDHQTVLRRLWVWYLDEGFSLMEVDVSHDGGLTWGASPTADSVTGLVGSAGDGGLKLVRFDLNTQGYVHRVRFRVVGSEHPLRLVKLGFEYEMAGI